MGNDEKYESKSDLITKYCVDKFVDFFAKHWLKILILIGLLLIENNRRFLGFAVEYVTGSIKVDADDVITLLQVIPILLVSYLAYKSNARINEIQEKESENRAKKQKEEEQRKKDAFFQQYQIVKTDYYVNLKPLDSAVKGLANLLVEIEKSDYKSLENFLIALEAMNSLALIKIKEVKYYSEAYIQILIAGIEYKSVLNQKIDFLKEIDVDIYKFTQALDSIERMVFRLKQIKKEQESLSEEKRNYRKFYMNAKIIFSSAIKKDQVDKFLKKINELEKELEKS